LLREFYLQQNAFHDVDTYCKINVQAEFLDVILYYKELAEAALASGISVPNLTSIPVLEELGRSKFEEDFNDLLPKLRKRIKNEISGLKED
jgi:V/A-type H+-transporting ATPase subunit A